MLNTSRKSPNFSSRDGYPVRVCIIHATAGGLKSSLDWLCNPAARVSSHYVISRAGTLYQLVAETEAAWHAGDAIWQGETAVNEMSIGVELENRTGMTGFVGQDPYPEVQVQKLVDLARNLKERYPNITFARHLDVAIPIGRKTDPKGFAWRAFRARLATPITKRYKARKAMISTKPEGGEPYAGELLPGEEVIVDKWYANGRVHLADGRGFPLLQDLEPL